MLIIIRGGRVTKKEEIIAIEKQLQEISSMLEDLPVGKLLCAKNGKYFKWFAVSHKKKAYIPKEERQLAERLAYRRYLEELQLDLKDELRLTKLTQRSMDRKYRHIKLLENAGILDLLQEKLGLDSELKQWQEADYKSNPYYREELKIKVHEGLYVRSKSELMIAMMLIRYQIPFRYECELQIANKVLYPDFTILHPKTKKIIYWEHLGLTDNYKYCRDNYGKLLDYFAEDIWFGDNLILTSETRRCPLDYETIEHRIKEFFF